MKDNTTSHIADEYDSKINQTIPYYAMFHKETINTVKVHNSNPAAWLDAGCGTGTMVLHAIPIFPKTTFTLADPSPQMLAIAREKLSQLDQAEINYLETGTQVLDLPSESFDVITTIQSNHYFDKATRAKAVQNCYRMLKPGGIYITFENIRPITDAGISLGLKRWQEFQMLGGKTSEEARAHVGRFDKEYFPITIEQHLELLRGSGFAVVEIIWAAYMQAGFYAIK
ncbi:MAG: class I SAM-dependent methyltransferase [Ignavibacteriales bacterium]